MAERINVSAINRQVVYGKLWYDYDPAFRARDLLANNDLFVDANNPLTPPSQRPFSERLRDFTVNSAVGWAQNLNPRGKDRFWAAGVGCGLFETAATVAASQYISEHHLLWITGKIVFNLALTQATSLAFRYLSDREDQDWGRSLSRGIGAGGTYGSVGMALWKIGESIVTNVTHKAAEKVAKASADAAATAPRPTVTVEPTKIPPTPIIEATSVPTTVPTAIPNPGSKALEIWQNRGVVGNNGDYLGQLAGEKLQFQDTLIDKALRQQGKTINDLSSQALSAARNAVKQALENQTNKSADDAIHLVAQTNPNINLADQAAINMTKNAIKANLDQWFNDSQHQADLSGLALKAINQQTVSSFSSKTTQFIVDAQLNHPEFFVEHIVLKGETAGHMLLKMGLEPTWDGKDWQAFVMLRELNPGVFTELRNAMGLSPDQFEDLIRRLQAGGPDASEAYQTLIKYMGRVEAGKHIRLLSAQAAKSFASIK